MAAIRYCVVMISMNEEQAISGQIEAIRKACGNDIDIILVDSSSDNTPRVAEHMGAKVIRQFPPIGYGRAMLAAQMKAAELDYEAFVMLDCDMSYPAEEIVNFVGLLEQGYDCVSGSRLLGKNEGMPLLNQIGNRLFAWAVFLLFGLRTSDLTTGMRAFRTSTIKAIQWVPLRFFPAEQILRTHQAGFKIKEVPIEYSPRVGEVKMRKVRDSLALIKAILHCRVTRPV